MSLSLGFGILFTLVTIMFGYLFYHNFTHASALDKRGIVTGAEIIRKFEQSSTSSSNLSITNNPKSRKQGPTSYLVEYEYETQGGQVILETENVGKEYQASLEIGGIYDVKYDPENPDISTLSYVGGYERGVRTLQILITIFSILSLICWGFYFRK
ncbi:DUF3592 domain-containing protein [Kiloniella antarctica]|uniref:DUF3592 domain-containing protein n=1 Tax=Kiloniella antarctica TaxID=1550907 RepID=A0ABW5BHV9_9PROT